MLPGIVWQPLTEVQAPAGRLGGASIEVMVVVMLLAPGSSSTRRVAAKIDRNLR